MKSERIFTETPKKSIWDRIEILTTINGVKNELIRQKSKNASKISLDLVDEKSKGIVFCVRSAKDLFSQSTSKNLTPSLMNLYYGLYNLLCALLISDVNNELTLSDIEKFSKNGGHGLKAIYNDDVLEIGNNEFLYVCNNGFFPNLLKKWGYSTPGIAMSKNFKKIIDIPEEEKHKLISLKALLSRIPELKNIYSEIFSDQPNYIHYNARLNPENNTHRLSVSLFKNTDYLAHNQINDILSLNFKYKFEYVEDQHTKKFVCDEEIPEDEISRYPKYFSPLASKSTIKPMLGVDDPLLINFQTLYMLSIWTRYRPNLWRKICEGELDQFRSLFSIYIEVAERILPNLFLNKFYDRQIVFASHSYYS